MRQLCLYVHSYMRQDTSVLVFVLAVHGRHGFVEEREVEVLHVDEFKSGAGARAPTSRRSRPSGPGRVLPAIIPIRRAAGCTHSSSGKGIMNDTP